MSFHEEYEAYKILKSFVMSLDQQKSRHDFVKGTFDAQRRFVEDKSPLVAALCSRRAGKSYAAGLKMFIHGFENDSCTILYLALTRATAKRIMWKDIIKDINKKFEVGANFNEAELTCTLHNGSVLYFAGADSTKDEMEKVLGGKIKLAIIDEAGSFRQDLSKLCYEMIEPALADYDGTLCMIGTPTDLLNSLFHKVTTKKEPRWSLHKWNTTENIYIKDNWAKRLRILKESNPQIEETPFFRRMYLGEWVVDLTSFVYKFEESKNTAQALSYPKDEYYYVLGIDLGYNDDSAFVVVAFHPHDKATYIVESYKRSKMIVSDVFERINFYQNKYEFVTIVIDNSSKQVVEELKARYSLDLSAAEKIGKNEMIEIMNSEFCLGNIKILDDANEGLKEEYSNLIWDEKAGKRIEHPACPNHASDAALYAWRASLSYLSKPKHEAAHSFEDKEEEWLMAQDRAIYDKKNKPFWEDI